MKLYLASQSPRRRELLDQIDVSYECLDVDINEDWDGKEQARDYVARLALEKAQTGYKLLEDKTDCVVLGADTSVVLDDDILGKATNRQEVYKMLSRLSGRVHYVYTGVALVGFEKEVLVNLNRVTFRPLSQNELESYAASNEPLGKAGGYAIQGMAAKFIERIEGSYSGIMGLPLFDVAVLLKGKAIIY